MGKERKSKRKCLCRYFLRGKERGSARVLEFAALTGRGEGGTMRDIVESWLALSLPVTIIPVKTRS